MADKRLTMEIKGMTCAACASRIEKGLRRMAGVVDAQVNLARERASVVYDDDRLSPVEVADKIRDLGYDVVTEKAELDIRGMTCAACARRIEKGLARLEGVIRADVNLATERGTVEYYPAALDVAEIVKKVKDLGYDASPGKTGQTFGRRKSASRSGAFSSPPSYRRPFSGACFTWGAPSPSWSPIS